eukprot:TRINITY_DN50378_c0_g1_i1.p1 TRINITY_DN50378_c0_g1~~TRINITY_DN50378_c0_g1_i1.p1  ORF type:complete len:291 (-),score=28.13 TRINITY_DN50378_c0_g1_i1:26-898(-)
MAPCDQYCPPYFQCPLSCEPMREPVLLKSDGCTYERSSIEEWFKKSSVSPMTGAPIHGDIAAVTTPDFKIMFEKLTWEHDVGSPRHQKNLRRSHAVADVLAGLMLSSLQSFVSAWRRNSQTKALPVSVTPWGSAPHVVPFFTVVPPSASPELRSAAAKPSKELEALPSLNQKDRAPEVKMKEAKAPEVKSLESRPTHEDPTAQLVFKAPPKPTTKTRSKVKSMKSVSPPLTKKRRGRADPEKDRQAALAAAEQEFHQDRPAKVLYLDSNEIWQFLCLCCFIIFCMYQTKC